MLSAFGRAFRTPDLRRKLLFTLAMIGVYRLGSVIPGPGVSYVAIQTCLDQVTFMESLVEPNRLRARILLWTEEETRVDSLPPKAGAILEAVLFRGELPRGDVATLAQVSERTARRITAALLDAEVLTSESPRAPLRLAFPARLASRWMPGLFPDKTG